MKRALTVTLLIVFAIVATACGGGDPTAGPSPTTSTTGSPTDTPLTTSPTPGGGRTGRTVDVIDNAYVPAEITVTVGTEVIWSQTGTSTHTVTASDNSFDSHPDCPNDISACMKPGDVFRHTFGTAGRFTYACEVHGELMSGTVVVG